MIRRSDFGPLLSALMRTTFTNTIVEGGIRSNVIPGIAEATVNMRLLPGVTGEQAVRELRRTIHDRRVKIIVGSDDQTAAEAYQSIRERQRIAASSTETDLYRALAREIKAQYPGTVVTRALYEAGTDAEPWRRARHPRLRPAALPRVGRRPRGHARHRRACLHHAVSTRAPTWSSGSCARWRPASRQRGASRIRARAAVPLSRGA